MPQENLIYVADSLFTPYGERTAAEIEQRVHHIANFLVNKKVKALVVACNTATAAGVESLRNRYQIPIIGLEPALKPAATFSANETVGVLATKATLDSQKYHSLRSRFLDKVELVERASSLFVELVEKAPRIDEIQLDVIEKELQPFKDASVDSLVLGCTHYPFLTQAIQAIMGKQVTLYESALPVAKEVQRRLESHFNLSSDEGQVEYFSSSPEMAQQTFESLLGKKIDLKRF